MTVAEAQRRVGAREYQRWRILDRIEPFGDDRGDVQAGIITSNIYNALMSARTTPRDFIPRWGRSAAASEAAQQRVAAERLKHFLRAKARGGTPV